MCINVRLGPECGSFLGRKRRGWGRGQRRRRRRAEVLGHPDRDVSAASVIL